MPATATPIWDLSKLQGRDLPHYDYYRQYLERGMTNPYTYLRRVLF